MMLSEKITLTVAILILASLLLTGQWNFEIYFIIIFIGVLIIRELTDIFTTSNIKNRMNIFIYLFCLIFIVIVGKKIVSILSI